MGDVHEKEIGGYFKLGLGDLPHGVPPYRFATARQALVALLAEITSPEGSAITLKLPAMVCPDVPDYVRRVLPELKLEFYHVDADLRTQEAGGDNGAFLYHCNFFGLAPFHPGSSVGTIIDHAHAFFEQPITGHHHLYSPRKFFAVPDGGYLYTAEAVAEPPTDWGASIPLHMAIRHGGGAADGLERFRAYEHDLSRRRADEGMSALARALVQTTDLNAVRSRRLSNFARLHERLSASNRFSALIDSQLSSDAFVPYSYPYLTDDGSAARQVLHKHRVWASTLWARDSFSVELSTWETDVVTNTVHVPIDQRYGNSDMLRAADAISEHLA